MVRKNALYAVTAEHPEVWKWWGKTAFTECACATLLQNHRQSARLRSMNGHCLYLHLLSEVFEAKSITWW